MLFQKTIKVKERNFKFIKERRYQEVAIYTHKNLFLRIGEQKSIEKEIEKHNTLVSYNFPLPTILEQGKLGNKAYYIENSLGKHHFGDIFAKEMKANGKISTTTLSEFLDITTKYAKAQLKTIKTKGSFSAFAKAVHLDLVIKELPGHKNKIIGLFKEVEAKLKDHPFVLTHGDFNPHNLYKKGVIDFEHQHYAPTGYDLVTNIFNISYFPKVDGFEFKSGYDFIPAQKRQYLKVMDGLYTQYNLPKISTNFKYFGFCRAMWLIARMHKYPRLQQFRYKLFKKMYLN